MNQNKIEICLIVDASPSMQHLTSETIDGLTSYLCDLKLLEKEVILSIIFFNSKSKIIINRENIKEINIQKVVKQYNALWGYTALYDAVGSSIDRIGEALYKTEEKDRPSKVIFTITTDGIENASKEYTKIMVKERIRHQTEKYNWEFLFTAANINAEENADDIGIDNNRAVNYTHNSRGVKSVYTTFSTVTKSLAEQGSIEDDWKNQIK